jgi:LemA protein
MAIVVLTVITTRCVYAEPQARRRKKIMGKNKVALIIAGIAVAAVVLIAVVFITTNNRAISLEEQILSADSDIQVQEKRRTDLIYNLVDCVKKYDKYEAGETRMYKR